MNPQQDSNGNVVIPTWFVKLVAWLITTVAGTMIAWLLWLSVTLLGVVNLAERNATLNIQATADLREITREVTDIKMQMIQIRGDAKKWMNDNHKNSR